MVFTNNVSFKEGKTRRRRTPTTTISTSRFKLAEVMFYNNVFQHHRNVG
jgi:hypothetical protein